MASLTILPKSQHPGSWGSCAKLHARHFYEVLRPNYVSRFLFYSSPECGKGLPIKKRRSNGPVDHLTEEGANALAAGDPGLNFTPVRSTVLPSPTIFAHFSTYPGRGEPVSKKKWWHSKGHKSHVITACDRSTVAREAPQDVWSR
jgi:hypothetical protein